VDGSDAELIARVLAHDDRRAFAALVGRHQGAILGLLTRLAAGDRARAEDLAQEVFVRAYRHLGQYAGGAFGGWIYRIAVRAFLDTVRRAHPPALPPEEAVEPPASLLRHDLEGALAELREEERIAIVVTFAQDHSHEEAAAILGWPLGTVKTLVLRARKKLARRLVDWKERQ
jgi:RNA polymerase sigma factor (sigma-70 family)